MVVNREYEEEHARAEALFEHIGTGAIATDEHGRIYRVNDAALEMLEYKREEMLGKWFPRVIHEVDERGMLTEQLDRPIARAFVSGKPVSENSYYRTKTGKIIPISLTVSPILLNGRPIGAVEVFQDISLEFEVDRMKTEFISIASHQLRTPLSAINTYANMLYSGFYGELNKDQRSHMATILTAIERMNGLISTLLDVSQLEAGKISVKPQKLDVCSLVNSLIKDHSQIARNKGLAIVNNCSDTPVIITCDRLLLGEVFSNLISNALKYSRDGSEVVISLKNLKREIVFSVKDTGYGIPKKMQKYIFTKFYRADNIKKIDTTGTGLGLYLAKQIADVLGGKLWFESTDKKGSTFYFSLPKEPDNS